jgi:hypothetical protein
MKGIVKYTGYWFVEYEDYWMGDNRCELIKKEAVLPIRNGGIDWSEYDGKEVSFEIDKETNQAIIIPVLPTESILKEETKPGFEEKRMALLIEHAYNQEVGDEGLFPNHTDKDIWIAGFKAGIKYS